MWSPSMHRPIANRAAAGQQLAGLLSAYRGRPDVIVLALPRGGVPVAYPIAHELGLRLDLMLVRKLGLPWHEELAMGAIASGGVRVLNEEVVRQHGVDARTLARVAETEHAELRRREHAYRGERPWPVLEGQTVLLVDDGLATGATMRAAISAVRHQGAAAVVVAVPVAPPDTLALLAPEVDALICPLIPEDFFAIGQWYLDFGQTSDAEVIELLQRAWQEEENRFKAAGHVQS